MAEAPPAKLPRCEHWNFDDLLMKLKTESSKVGKVLRALARSRLHLSKLKKQKTEIDAGGSPPGFKKWKP